MSDQIDVNVVAIGGESIDKVTSSLDRLISSMEALGSNSALDRLAQQMELMQATMVTGFANLAATSDKMIASMTGRQAQAIEEGGAKAAAAIEAAGLRMKTANARTWEQIQRGSAANVTAAFNQLAQGIPVEAVRARYGELAATTAQSLDGQLEKLKQFQANAKSLYQTTFKPLAGATESEIDQARAMNAARDAALRVKSASPIDARALLGLPSEESSRSIGRQIAAQLRAGVEAEKAAPVVDPRALLGLPSENVMRGFASQLAVQMRTSVEQENLRARSASSVDPRALLGLPSQAEARAAGQQIAAQIRESVTAENLRARSASTVDARTLLGLPSESEVRSAGRRIAAQLREAVEAEQAAERQRGLNASFLNANPAAQLRRAGEVQTYLQQPGSSPEGAATRFGSAAASADINALRAAHEALVPAVRNSAAAVTDHSHAMNEAHSLARGLAGSLGGLWLTYGSLVPLAAGAAIAAALKNVVSVGAEVEHQLTNVLALTKSSVNLDQFLSVSDGSLRSLTEGANAMRMLAQNGLNAAQSLQVLPAILDLATVGEMSVGQAALAATGAASAFGLGFSEAGRIADIFAVTAANSNTSVLAMTESMKQASTVASLFKVSIEETAAMLGLLAKINVTGGAAGTSLTNMLTGLYEPTDKGKRALKDLGVETQTASGALKPLTQLLEELRGAMAGFTDSAKVDLLGSIFTVRGVKSAQLALDNIKDFKQKTEEAATATGFMAGVVRQLEDDTTGGFQRLGVVVQNSFVRSFQEASPFIQHIALTLGDAFKDGGTASNGLRNFSTNVARLTGVLVENLDVVTMLATGYVALRALGPTIEFIKAAVTASMALTSAQVAEAAAIGAVTTANLGLGASSAQVATAVAAQTAATEASTAATATWEAAILPVLGAVGIAVGVAAAAWLLFRDNTSEADRASEKLSNSLHVIHEALDREIEQLQKANKLWDERNNRYMPQGAPAPTDIDAARARVTELENQARAKNINPKELLNPTTHSTGINGITTSSIYGSERLAANYREAKATLAGLLEQQERAEKVRDPAAAAKRVQDAKAQLEANLEKFYSEGMQTNTAGDFYQKNAAARAISAKAADIAAQITDSSLKEVRPEDELKRVERLSVDLKQLQDQRNSMLQSRPEVNRDSARAAIEEMQEDLRLKQMQAKSQIDDLKSQNKRGELGDLQLINRELAIKLALDEKAIEVAQRQKSTAITEAQRQKYANAETTARQQIIDDKAAATRSTKDLFDRMSGEELQYRAKSLESQGQLQDSFNLEWEAKYSNVLDRLNLDIESADNGKYRDGLIRYRNFLEQMRVEGEKSAIFKMDMADLDKDLQILKTKLADIRNHAGPGVGGAIGAILDRKSLLESSLPQLQEDYAVAKDDAGDDPVKLKAAAAKLKEIQAEMTALRNVGIDIGNAIAQSLTDAFGKGGAALGGLITTAATYDARVQDIQKQLEESDGGADAKKKAADDMATAQINAYGNMAGAAKGFFDQNSKGYKILATTEKAYRAVELAMAAESFIKKTLFKAAEVTQTVAGDGLKMASGTTATAVDVANAGASGTAWGITAVARSIASLPFPANLAAGAATMAALVALGIKLTGGFNGGGQTQAEKEQQNATGTVLGDRDAKSESNAKSLDLVEKNTYNNLIVAQSMLASLRSIDSNIKGFVSQLLQNSEITDPDVHLNTNNGLGTTLASGGMSALGSLAYGDPVLGLASFAVNKIPVINSLVSKIGNAVFGGKQTVEASGFTMDRSTLGQVAAGGASAMSYADVKTSGGWFRSSSLDTKTAPLGAEANLQITRVITGMGDAITAAAGLLGVDGADFKDKLNGFVIDIGKIDLKGLSSADAQAKVAAVFSKLGDQMAQAAFGGLEQFQQAGEGYLQTLTRVANDYATIDAVFKSFGTTYAEVGTASIAAREQLIDMAGGLDKFTSQASWFFENMMSKAQQTAATSAAIQPTLAKYGLSTQGADAVQKFTDLTIAMGAMGSAGAQAYTELMGIAQAFKSVTDVATDLQDQIDDLLMSQAEKDAAARAKLDPVNQKLYDELVQARAVAQAKQDLLTAYQNESSAIQSTIDRLKSLSTSLRSFVNGLQIGNMSPLNPADQYGAARAQFETTLQKAQAGDTAAQGNLQSAAQAFLQASKTANASNSTYQSDYQRVVSTMTGMADTTDSQVKIAQTSLSVLHDQVSQLVKIDTGVTSVASAINNLAVIMAGGKDSGTNTVALSSLYKELLGRDPDQAGLDFWNTQLQNGVSFTDVIGAIKNSAEYADHIGKTPATTVVTPSTDAGTAIGNTNTTSVSSAISALYQNVLGRAADQAGLDYWVQQMQSGSTLSTIEQELKKSDEYKDHIKVGTASNSSASVAPAVTVDPYSAATAQTAEIVAQLATLNKQITTLRDEQQSQSDNQLAATMQAGTDMGADVTDAVKDAARAAAWTSQNKAALR
jgi:TP901 family phage tail tape measure protein